MISRFAPDDVHARVAKRWDFNGPLPQPTPGWLRCPICGDEQPTPRYWRFHQRPASSVRWRCDVSFKCTDCSHVWVHGIPLPDAVGEQSGVAEGSVRHISRREAERIMKGQS